MLKRMYGSMAKPKNLWSKYNLLSTRPPSISVKLKTDAKVFVCSVGIVDNAGGAEILTPGLHAFDVGVAFFENSQSSLSCVLQFTSHSKSLGPRRDCRS